MAYVFEKYSAGGSGGIVDVAELPTENIKENVLYRVTKADCYLGASKRTGYNDMCYVVDGLPETGKTAITADGSQVTYYNKQDGEIWVYADDTLASEFGVPAGWYQASVMFSQAGFIYGGVITSIDEAVNSEAWYYLITDDLFTYLNGEWVEVGGNGIIEVDELPTENIKQDVIYKTSAIGCAGIYVLFNGEPVNYIDAYAALFNMPIEVLVMESFPDVPMASGAYAYIVLSTGEVKASIEGVWYEELNVFGTWITDISQVTEEGIAYLLKTQIDEYGIPNKHDNRFYEYDGEWVDSSTEYREQIQTLESEKAELRASANFTKYAEVGSYNNGFTKGAYFGGLTDKSIKSIYFPDYITDGIKRFNLFNWNDYNYLTHIEVDANNTVYHSESNCVIKTDSNELVLGCNTSIIPEGVTAIGDSVFMKCSFVEMVLPAGLITIGGGAFRHNGSLKTIVIPNSVTSIGQGAFESCYSLETITFTGTKAQWKAIEKKSSGLVGDLTYEAGNYTVYCTDGTIAKDGTET